jgi:ABC-type sugar transport system ATPase subunit
MLGRTESAVRPDGEKARVHVPTLPTPDDAVLSVRSLRVPGRLSSLDFDVYRGEVLGVAGLVGAGRTTLLRAVAGLEWTATGTVALKDGRVGPLPSSPRAAWRRGIALVPEDRKDQGLALQLPGSTNATLADLWRASRWGIHSSRRTQAQAAAAALPVGLRPAALEAPAATLSGGNQQKLLLARCLHRGPRLILADEPTRGVDIGAKHEILASLRRLADDGVGVVVVSSEIEEVLAVADRIIVLAQGRLVDVVHRDEGFDLERILHAAFDRRDTP